MTLAVRPADTPDSPVARWDGRWRLAALLLMAGGAATVQHLAPAAVAFLASLLLAVVARLPARAVAARVGLLGLAVLPFAAVLPFTAENGTVTAAVVGLKCLAVGTVGLVLTSAAPLPTMFAAARRLGVPGPLVLVAQLAHRYTFVLAAEARRVRTAMRTRGFRAGTNRHTYRTLGHAAGAVLVSGGERAERVAAAMRCRGFDGTARDRTRFRTRPADVLSFLLAAAGTIALVMWDRM